MGHVSASLHKTIFAATGGSLLAAVWEWARRLDAASTVPMLLSLALTVWQFYLLRKRELSRERIEEADAAAEAVIDREKRRREAAREQDRLDAQQAIELARLRRGGRAAKPAVEGSDRKP